MENYSIPGRHLSEAPIPVLHPASDAVAASSTMALRFPADDGATSLKEMAQRDLEATLQLLAERAQYITAASGVAIALDEGGEMICRARSGGSAPELGAELQVNSGLTGESVRSRQLLRCDDADRDGRVNQESCRALGIKSVMVIPLLTERRVLGVFELLADRSCAFEDRDVVALERLAEMALVALDHAGAAKRALQEIGAQASELLSAGTDKSPFQSAPPAAETTPDAVAETVAEAIKVPGPSTLDKIRRCEACGFPVSEGRSVCLDCEAARESLSRSEVPLPGEAPPAFLSSLANQRKQRWFQAHMYTIGTVLVAALTAALLYFRLR